MLVDAQPQHEVEGRVDRLVEEVEGLENKRAEEEDKLVDKVAKVAKEVAEVAKEVSEVAKEVVEVTERIEGIIGSQNGDAADDSIHEERNVNVGNVRNGCSYKEFVAYKPKEFDGMGGAVAYIRWVEKMESVQDMSGCIDHQKVKYTAGLLTGKALTWWNSEIQTRGRAATVDMTWENFKALMREEYCPSNEMQRLETEFWNHYIVGAGHSAYTDRFHELARIIRGMVAETEPSTIKNSILKAGVLTDEAVRNRALKRNDGESSKEGNVKGDNKRARNGKVFATTTNHVRREYTGMAPKVGPKMVNPLDARNWTNVSWWFVLSLCWWTDHTTSAFHRLNLGTSKEERSKPRYGYVEGG
ncbi:reverse transcriptase domain-containing protein [Tanacetum coccineum]